MLNDVVIKRNVLPYYVSTYYRMNNLVIMACFAISAPIVAVILNYLGWPAVSYFSFVLLLVAAALNFYFARLKQYESKEALT